jgi:hypothetical protein
MFKRTDSVLNSESVSSYVIETLIVSTSLKPAFIFGLHIGNIYFWILLPRRKIFFLTLTQLLHLYTYQGSKSRPYFRKKRI